MRSDEVHNAFLERLITHLGDIGEHPRRMRWIMKEGIYLKEDSIEYRPFPDLICVYKDYGIPIEIKGSRQKKTKGLKQLCQGALFILNELELECPYGRFVTYRGRSQYAGEMIFFEQNGNIKVKRNGRGPIEDNGLT